MEESQSADGTSSSSSNPSIWTPDSEDVVLLGGPHGWIARGDKQPTEKRVPFNRPKLMQVYRALPFVMRYANYWVKNFKKRDRLFINTFEPLRHKNTYGVPCGGIGAGSIGRDFRGGFCKFTLKPGLVEHHVKSVKADQFILTVKKPNGSTYQVVLGVNDGNSNKLNNWNFDIPEENIVYRGLYPRSWTIYKLPEHGITVVVRQTSPILPNDYKDSSLPLTLFSFDVYNETDQQLEVSVTFTFRNGTGCKKTQAEGACKSHSVTSPEGKGVLLEHFISSIKCTYGLISPDPDNTTVTHFDPTVSHCPFWDHLEEHGTLPGINDEIKTSELAVACSTKVTIEPQSNSNLRFALVWHMPTVRFTSKQRCYQRFYSNYFGPRYDVAFDIGCYGLQKQEEWEKQIEEWQNPVLEEKNVPEWYKSAIFNELYYLTDGGSVWFAFDEKWKDSEPHLSEYTLRHFKEFGRFAYLESWEYRMFNTYDVHFYASFALAQLFPKLECVIQMEMRDQFELEVPKQVRFHMEGDRAPVKTTKRVPHDIGNPADEPFLKVNAYVMHDTGKWKDLNLKFVLTTYRDYYLLMEKDVEFLKFFYPAVQDVIELGLTKWDRNGDGMIENFGAADQTYDAWKMVGVSAYCGSLWLAALAVATEMAKDIGDEENAAKYEESLNKAKKVFDTVLWNGSYYNFDERHTSGSTIMADQLCGYWYLHAVNPDLCKGLLPQSHVDSALETIFNYNVVKFADCKLGAVNGMLPTGKVDRSYIQADEVWTGITYSLAAFYIQQDQPVKGFETAAGCYDACFNRFGLQYQTPEALYRKKFYRAIGYMRPLSIWAMQSALLNQQFFKS